jgi:dolichol-phosphate mannosyltransferase
MRPAMIAVVIPCHRVRKHVLAVLAAIGPEVGRVYVVDDACPERTADLVEAECHDPRVRVLRNERNLGVGGATLAGLRMALADGAEVVVKLDGDGQMDPALIPRLVQPILAGEADYAKGNRFFELEGLAAMPRSRLLGNALLSFASKLSSGYWNVFDPTNGFTAIHGAVARQLPLAKLATGWFFESDLLFRLGTLRAVVCDVPMPAVYEDESSNLRAGRVIPTFLRGHFVNTAKRIFYSYFLRNFNFASIELVAGKALVLFGLGFGLWQWAEGSLRGVPATSGTVMLAALPVLLGTQLLLAFLSYDLQNVPRDPLQRRLVPLPPRP